MTYQSLVHRPSLMTGGTMNWRSVVATCVIVLCASSAHAQFDWREVPGCAQDTTGAVLPGVDVTLVNVGTRIERQAVTNEAGLYTFPHVPVASRPIVEL